MISSVDRSSRVVRYTTIFVESVVVNLLTLIFLRVSDLDLDEVNEPTLLAIVTLCYIVSMALSGEVVYSRRVSTVRLVALSVKSAFAFFVVWLIVGSLTLPSLVFSKAIILYFLSILLVGTLLRLAALVAIDLLFRVGSNPCRVVVLGSSEGMRELLETMTMERTTQYQILGYFDSQRSGELDQYCRYLGGAESAMEYIESERVDRVYNSLSPRYARSVIMPLIGYCAGNLIRFYTIPNLKHYLHRRVSLEMFGEVPVLSIYSEPLSQAINRFIKRTFDILLSLLFLCTLFPLIYLVVAIAIKIESPGEVIFRQRRHGLNGKEFWCYKFRSMRANVDADTLQATEQDPRKTKFGDFMRRTSIDELPQFINVLKGEMSIVGPRPHMLRHTEEYSKIISTYMVRHYLRPGITGWAQVTGFRGETKQLSDMYGRVKADIWYLEHWRFSLDLYIIYLTLLNVITRRDRAAY